MEPENERCQKCQIQQRVERAFSSELMMITIDVRNETLAD